MGEILAPLSEQTDVNVSGGLESRTLSIGTSGEPISWDMECELETETLIANVSVETSSNAEISASAGASDVELGANVENEMHWIYNDYEDLNNKPEIESVVLEGNRSLTDFGMSVVSNAKILDLFR